MKTRNILMSMIAGLALVMAPMMACGPDDPTTNQNQNDGDGGDGDNDGNGEECSTSSDCDGDLVCEGNQCVEDDTGNGDECTSNEECDGNEICNDDNECILECTFASDCDGDEVCEENRCVEEVIEYDCEIADWHYGQIGFDDGTDHSGGTPSTDPLTHSAGLQDVIDTIEAELANYTDNEISDDTIEVDLSSDPIAIDGATVTAIDFKSAHEFWVEDADTGIFFFRFESQGEEGVPEQPSVGDRVSFNVDMVSSFRGTPQIRAFSDWEIIEEDTDVPYTQIEDQEITNEAHYDSIVRVVLKLTSNSWDCGFDECFTALYGSDGQHEITYKTGSDFDEAGSCVTFVGPVSSFPGYYTENGEAQVDASNWDWTYTGGGGGLD